MSSIHSLDSQSTGPRRGGIVAVLALIHASALGMAASVIHGAFDRMAVKGREARNTPRPAAPPQQEKAVVQARGGWWRVLKRTVSEVNSDRVLAVAGGVTFYTLLSLFPAITVLVSLYGLIAEPQSISQHLELLRGFLPEGAMSIIGEQAMRIARSDQARLGVAALAGLLVALWSANAAMKSTMDALNIAYDAEETRGFIRLNLISLLFTLSSIIGLLVLFAMVAAVPVILETFWLGGTVDVLVWAGRWPVTFLLILLALAVLYRFGPSRPVQRWRWITPGSLMAAAGLLALSMLFSWYAANIGKFNETYGSLGAVIGFMTWMWLSATIVLAGAELNGVIESADQPAMSRSKR
ncbi:MAG: YihY/virulence factor BrkB family protein [Aestuariivirga sp.]|nr:YihY/virulence factor BrkB family protein [Aestuariivirga sp.]